MKAQLEPIARTEDSSLYSRHVVEARFDHPLHYHPEIEITAIAFACGFRNLSNFNRSFRERYTMSPRKYRQQV